LYLKDACGYAKIIKKEKKRKEGVKDGQVSQ